MVFDGQESGPQLICQGQFLSLGGCSACVLGASYLIWKFVGPLAGILWLVLWIFTFFGALNTIVCPCTQTEVLVLTGRWPYGIPTKPDKPNTLTRQSAVTNNAPRFPLYIPVTWNPARTWPDYILRLHSLHSYHDHYNWKNHQCINISLRYMSFILHDHWHCHWTFPCCFLSSLPIRLPVTNLTQILWSDLTYILLLNLTHIYKFDLTPVAWKWVLIRFIVKSHPW